MAVRTLDQIISELGSVYQPQIDSVQKQRALIPEQVQNDENQLQARQTQSFEDILGGARRRGLGFSGIPISEQAKYTATEFLPALAKARTQGRQQQLSLEDSLNQIYERRNQSANQLRQMDVDNDYRERDFAFQQQKYQDQLRAVEEERRQSAAKAARESYINSLSSQAQGGQNKPPSIQDQAFVSVQNFMAKGKNAASSDYIATLASANRGNQMDKLKIQFYERAGLKPLNVPNAGRIPGLAGLTNGGLRFY